MCETMYRAKAVTKQSIGDFLGFRYFIVDIIKYNVIRKTKHGVWLSPTMTEYPVKVKNDIQPHFITVASDKFWISNNKRFPLYHRTKKHAIDDLKRRLKYRLSLMESKATRMKALIEDIDEGRFKYEKD